jgi:hypothetical protein
LRAKRRIKKEGANPQKAGAKIKNTRTTHTQNRQKGAIREAEVKG